MDTVSVANRHPMDAGACALETMEVYGPPLRRQSNKDLNLLSQALVIYREESDVGPYLQALTAAGIETVPARADAVPRLTGMDGLVLTGGTDVDPALFAEARHPETEEPDTERDAVEMELLGEALELDLPVLAICRGLQVMNVFHDGTLVQHLDTVEHHRRRGGDRSVPAHDISIMPGSLLHSIAHAPEWRVNSRHHQAIKQLGQGLRVSGRDPFDGVIEAIERPDKRFVLGVQWHPENQALVAAGVAAGQLRIFERFGSALRQQLELKRGLRGRA